MTMQRQDYERVAFGIRTSRDDLIDVITRDSDIVEPERATVTKYVNELARNVAVQCAIDFQAVNKRFKVDQFMIDALGSDQALLAIKQYHHNRGGTTAS